jgi:integrase/recombinase XerD
MEKVASNLRDKLLVRLLFRLGCRIDRQTLEMLGNYITTNLAGCGNSPGFLFNLNRHRAWQIVRDCARKARLPDLVNPETGQVIGVSPHRLRDAFSVRNEAG